MSSIQENQIQGYSSPQSNYNAGLDWTISPTAFLSLKAARFWDNYKKLGVPDIGPIEWGELFTGISGLAASLPQPRGYTTIPRTATTVFDIATRNVIQADFSKALSKRSGSCSQNACDAPEFPEPRVLLSSSFTRRNWGHKCRVFERAAN